MSVRSLHSAASGMTANTFSIDTIANNLANAGTTAFKRSRANFEDLYYEHLKLPGGQDANGNLTPTGISVGLGTRIGGTQVDYRSGSLLETGNPLDLAIVGDGFFQVDDPDRGTLYTRAGTFTVNDSGQLVMASADIGRLVLPNISIPVDATEVSVSGGGVVSYLAPGSTEIQQAGTLTISRFANQQGLLQLGENLYAETNASGTAVEGIPGSDGRGTLRQGFLEQSNVEPVRELVDLIKTQRNFELNSQVVQASDQMLQLVANLRRF